ncbi:spore protease YyaC [Clostridium polynesiense]|uniref:spore protease YyaC n=1 Tax=Clostridium polynesiense TaxID=1325933 RepID=UPI0005915CD6|nr:spore protease YyaC [Clostridium polynesiense]
MKLKLSADSLDKSSILLIRDFLYDTLMPVIKDKRPILILCIGTDRSTGDSLGPLVGDKLKFLIRNHVKLFGNLESPLHAKNLNSVLEYIQNSYKNPYIIAVDACLGSLQNVGKVIIEKCPLLPGAAVNKNLPPVGDLSITGIVNISGALEFMVLQNTRLYTVMTLADTISKGIYHFVLKAYGGKKVSFPFEESDTQLVNK